MNASGSPFRVKIDEKKEKASHSPIPLLHSRGSQIYYLEKRFDAYDLM